MVTLKTPRLNELPLTPLQVTRLRAALAAAVRALGQSAPLIEGDQSPWSEDDKAAAQQRAEKWLERIRKRRAAREALQEKERPAGREPVAPEQFTPRERVELFVDLSAEVDAEMASAAELLIVGEISPNEFQRDMERAIWINARAAFIAGKVALGGPAEVSREDERELRKWGNFQVNRLRKFVAAIKAGELSNAQIAARAKLYAGALNAPYSTGQVRAFGDIKLPQVPGDGQTQCRTNCKCYLEYVPVMKDGVAVAVKVYWRLRPAEHCQSCLDLAKMSPFFQVEV